MHLYRDPNGRYYFRYALPRSLIQKLASHRHREVRLSLFTYPEQLGGLQRCIEVGRCFLRG